jgi:hypothetical protein
MPKGQPDRASLKDAQVAVSDLKPSGVTGGTIESHSCSICGTRVEMGKYNKGWWLIDISAPSSDGASY